MAMCPCVDLFTSVLPSVIAQNMWYNNLHWFNERLFTFIQMSFNVHYDYKQYNLKKNRSFTTELTSVTAY